MARPKPIDEGATMSMKDHIKRSKELEKDGVNGLSREKIKKMIGRRYQGKLTDEVMETIWNMGEDLHMEQYEMEEVFINHIGVMTQYANTTLSRYVDAVKYCTMKHTLKQNRSAFELVFPHKIKEWEEREAKAEAAGKPLSVTIESRISRYNNSNIVQVIDGQMLREWHESKFMEREYGLSVLLKLCRGDAPADRKGNKQTVSPLVIGQAASKIVDILAPPVVEKHDVNVQVTGGIQATLAEQLAKTTDRQMKQLKEGVSIDEVQTLGIGEVIDVDVEDGKDE